MVLSHLKRRRRTHALRFRGSWMDLLFFKTTLIWTKNMLLDKAMVFLKNFSIKNILHITRGTLFNHSLGSLKDV